MLFFYISILENKEKNLENDKIGHYINRVFYIERMFIKEFMNTKQKLKFIDKLASAGYKDEEIEKADFKKLLGLPGITIEELKEISNLQDAIKNKKVLSWLYGDGEKSVDGRDIQ